jgi:DNA-nicking Smr family endonuclease
VSCAEKIVRKRIVSSFSLFLKKLPFSEQEFEDVVVPLLMDSKNEFDVSKVENALFNMVGLVDKGRIDKQLNHEEKQKFYELARSPVTKLQEEYLIVQKEFLNVNDTDSIEWKKKKKEHQEIQKRLNEARKNAAADIFERMNSFGNMGSIIDEDDENSKSVQVDLHGLHVREAKEKIDEYILPILPALKKLTIITGYGSHGNSGEAILKESIKQYFSNQKIKCIESTKNKGILCLSC